MSLLTRPLARIPHSARWLFAASVAPPAGPGQEPRLGDRTPGRSTFSRTARPAESDATARAPRRASATQSASRVCQSAERSCPERRSATPPGAIATAIALAIVASDRLKLSRVAPSEACEVRPGGGVGSAKFRAPRARPERRRTSRPRKLPRASGPPPPFNSYY